MERLVALDVRVGTIVAATLFPESRKPAYKLSIDFGEALGIKHASVQLTENYTLASLASKQVIAIVNVPHKRIKGFKSEVRVLGVEDDIGALVLVRPDTRVANGVKLL